MKKKIKENIKKIIHILGMEDFFRYMVMTRREKKYEKLNENEKIVELKKWYLKNTDEELNLENPEGFNQKIQWLKINDFSDSKTKLSDKFLVRNWVKEQIGEKYLIPLYGAWDTVEQINLEELPEGKFILKANHGSSMNLVINNKNELHNKRIIKKLKYWIKTPYDLSGLEEQYYDIQRKIIAEKYIEQKDGNLLDYKIHCFDGEPKLIQVIGDRDLEKHTAKEAFFDIKWNENQNMYRTYGSYEEAPKRPELLNEMLDISKKLSKNYKYVRVDLYYLDGEIKFGEMTFTPASGIGKFNDKKIDKLVGDWIKI